MAPNYIGLGLEYLSYVPSRQIANDKIHGGLIKNMLKNRDIIRNQNHLNQTRDNFVISSYFPPKLTPTTTIPTQSITFLVPKKKKKKPIYLHPNSLLFSPFNGVEEATNSDPNSDLILHLLLSLHLDRRIR